MIEWVQIIKLLWIPLVGIGGWFFKGLSLKYDQLNKEVVELKSLSLTKDDDVLPRLLTIENTYISRDDLEKILEKRFDKLEAKIDKYFER